MTNIKINNSNIDFSKLNVYTNESDLKNHTNAVDNIRNEYWGDSGDLYYDTQSGKVYEEQSDGSKVVLGFIDEKDIDSKSATPYAPPYKTNIETADENINLGEPIDHSKGTPYEPPYKTESESTSPRAGIFTAMEEAYKDGLENSSTKGTAYEPPYKTESESASPRAGVFTAMEEAYKDGLENNNTKGTPYAPPYKTTVETTDENINLGEQIDYSNAVNATTTDEMRNEQIKYKHEEKAIINEIKEKEIANGLSSNSAREEHIQYSNEMAHNASKVEPISYPAELSEPGVYNGNITIPNDSQMNTLYAAILAEGGVNGVDAAIAITDVILNRSRSNYGGNGTNPYQQLMAPGQFAVTTDGAMNNYISLEKLTPEIKAAIDAEFTKVENGEELTYNYIYFHATGDGITNIFDDRDVH